MEGSGRFSGGGGFSMLFLIQQKKEVSSTLNVDRQKIINPFWAILPKGPGSHVATYSKKKWFICLKG